MTKWLQRRGVKSGGRQDARLNGGPGLSIVARNLKEERMTARLRAAALALTLASSFTSLDAASAQDYPVRPVKIVVPFGAGGPADVYSRVLAQHLSEALKQPFVVEDGRAPALSSAPTRSR